MIIFILSIYICETNENKNILTVSKNNKGAKLFSFEISQVHCLFLDDFLTGSQIILTINRNFKKYLKMYFPLSSVFSHMMAKYLDKEWKYLAA